MADIQVDLAGKEVFTVAQPEDRLATENSLNLLIKVKVKEDHTATEQSVLQGILETPTVLNARLMVKEDHTQAEILTVHKETLEIQIVHNARLMVKEDHTQAEIPIDATAIADLSAA